MLCQLKKLIKQKMAVCNIVRQVEITNEVKRSVEGHTV